MASYRRFKPRLARPVQDPRPHPLSSQVVDAVLRFHDEELDQGGGRTLLRLSRRRLAEAEVSRALGSDADRAARVAILYNEREGEIIRVLETALAA